MEAQGQELLCEKVVDLLKEISELRLNGKDRKNTEVQSKEKEIRTLLGATPNKWISPDKTIEELEGFLKNFLKELETSVPTNVDIGGTEVISNASGGLALKGIYLSKDLQELSRERKMVLNVPEKVTLVGSSKVMEDLTINFESVNQEQHFQQCVNRMGLSISGGIKVNRWGISVAVKAGRDSSQLEDTTKSSNKESAYASVLKYSFVPTASCEIHLQNLRLSEPALESLKQLQKTLNYENSDDLNHKLCTEFLQSYGSHVNCGMVTFGGVYEIKAETSKFKQDEKDSSFKILNDIINMSTNLDIFGTVVLDNSILRTSSSCNISTSYTDEQLKNTKVTIRKIGGSATAADLTEWKTFLLSHPATWHVIDRGHIDNLQPIWNILCNHISDLGNCQQLARALRKCWERETQLFDMHLMNSKAHFISEIEKKLANVHNWNQLPDKEFLKSCEGYVTECVSLKVNEPSSDSLWYEYFICNREAQVFIERAAMCIKASENKMYLSIMISNLLEPMKLIQVNKFPNISQILMKIQDSGVVGKHLGVHTFATAKEYVKEAKKEFVKADPSDSELQRKLCLDLQKIIDALQLNLKRKENNAGILLTGILYPVFSEPCGNSRYTLSFKDWDFLLSQMDKMESIVETLQSLHLAQAQALVILEALNALTEYGWQETDCIAGVQRMCTKLGKEMSPKVKGAVFTEHGTVITDLKILKDQLTCLYKNELSTGAKKASEQKKEIGDLLSKLDQEDAGAAPQSPLVFEDHDVTMQELLQQLGVKEYYPGKLTISKVLEIGADSLRDHTSTESCQIMWNFIRKVIMVHSTARKAAYVPEKSENTMEERNETNECDTLDVDELFQDAAVSSDTSIHPLDLIVLTILCSDQFLQQELMCKMAMCQFALPLLMPNGFGNTTFLLWALRSIVKKWSLSSQVMSKVFAEDNMVNVSIPTVAFVRLGACNVSKSKMLNEFLSDGQLNNFVNCSMEQGDVERKISKGLAEICWYLPSGNATLDFFTDAFAVINLRGDAKNHRNQFNFLNEVSSAIFIFVGNLGKEENDILKSLSHSKSKLFLILTPCAQDLAETKSQLKDLILCLNLTKKQFLKFGISAKDFITHLRERVKGILPSTRNDQKKLSLEEMADVARRHSFLVDEDTENCKKGKENVKEILSLIETEDVAQFRRENLHFQGDHWKQWSKIDKEQNRLKKRGTQPSGQYISDLELKKNKLREQQLGNKVSKFMVKFITEIHSKDQSRLFFLQWLKIQLDSRSRKNLRILHNRYKELCEQSGVQNEKLKDLDKIISESSLGIEHLLREMGQIYEAVESHSLEPQKNEYQQLPHCAAQLMLNGIPLELMDGDASNIPIHWITNVLDELGNIVDKGSRMFVITVLGVQSTGKSTLLNTMFGLQFAVSSGRCTRGAFIQLLKVKGDYTHKLGCDYIMVIDTEGLKAPELSQQDDSYEHDNELATLVIGLSDLTLINMAMENYCEMKDVLQIAVHAFIRMREVGRKPHCQFIHQNVGDVTAHERNIRDCRHFFDQLNEMTKSAARMENREEQYATFADVMEYNPSKNNWYIASLWHGNPPMAAVNTGYCENILDLKRYIFDCLEQRQSAWKAFTIQDFSKWMKDVWKAVKKENFIFSFRNSLVAEAYNGLSLSYCEWEWELRKDLLSWTQQSENKIGNALQSAVNNMLPELQQDLNRLITEKIGTCKQKLETYFSSGMDNVHLIERYKAEFQLGLDILAKELKNSAIDKCLDTISRQKGLLELNSVQKGYQQEVENQVNILLSICKQKKKELQEDELELEFEDMWRQVTSKLPHSSAGKKDIVLDMENALRDTMQAHTVSIQTSLIKEDHLDEFSVKQDHIDLKTIKAKTPLFIKKHIQGWEMSCAEQTKELFIHNIIQFLDEKEKGGMNYDQNYCRETLRTIDELVRNHSSDTFKLNENFKADFKLYISGFAVSRFQKMQDRFYKENDPMEKLEQQKQRYLEIFKDTYCRRDQTQKKADMFCEDCLKPAILQRIETHLGASVLEDVRCNRTSLALSTSKFFQAALLLHLMQEDQFQEYYRYINHYEDYASDWIKDRVIKHCTTLNPDGNSRFVELAIHILKQITHAAKEAIKDASTCTISTLIGDLLEAFVKKMEKELVIPTDKLDIVVFQNDGNIKHFAEAVLVSIDELEKALEEEIGKWEVTKVLFNLPTKPAEELINSLLNCKKQCPFCGVPCERAGPKHSEHFSEYHIPDGLCGYANTATEKLSTEICTTSVTSGEMFINEDTDYNYVLYRRYKSVNEYYNSWQIQADSSYSASSYWKWIFYRFNHQFAEKYKRDPADVPEGWNISEQQVKKDLEDTYKVNLDSLI